MFQVIDIRGQAVANTKYFFDANVWFYILFPSPYIKPTLAEYERFLNKISASIIKPKPKVVVTSMVISEVINVYLRKVGLNVYFKTNPLLEPTPNSGKDRYKDIYRKSQEFKRDYDYVCASFKAYHKVFEFVNDEFSSFTPNQVLKNLSVDLDFNDNYVFELAKKMNYTIVTHDIDFCLETVEILTSNKALLTKAKALAEAKDIKTGNKQ